MADGADTATQNPFSVGEIRQVFPERFTVLNATGVPVDYTPAEEEIDLRRFFNTAVFDTAQNIVGLNVHRDAAYERLTFQLTQLHTSRIHAKRRLDMSTKNLATLTSERKTLHKAAQRLYGSIWRGEPASLFTALPNAYGDSMAIRLKVNTFDTIRAVRLYFRTILRRLRTKINEMARTVERRRADLLEFTRRHNNTEAALRLTKRKPPRFVSVESIKRTMLSHPCITKVDMRVTATHTSFIIATSGMELTAALQPQEQPGFQKALLAALIRTGVIYEDGISYKDMPLSVPLRDTTFEWIIPHNDPRHAAMHAIVSGGVISDGFHTMNPHWYANHTTCLGDFGTPFLESLDDGDIESAFVVLMNFLSAFNMHDIVGSKIGLWYADAITHNLFTQPFLKDRANMMDGRRSNLRFRLLQNFNHYYDVDKFFHHDSACERILSPAIIAALRNRHPNTVNHPRIIGSAHTHQNMAHPFHNPDLEQLPPTLEHPELSDKILDAIRQAAFAAKASGIETFSWVLPDYELSVSNTGVILSSTPIRLTTRSVIKHDDPTRMTDADGAEYNDDDDDDDDRDYEDEIVDETDDGF